MSEIVFEGAPAIDAYGEGGFRLGGLRHAGSLLLLPTRMDDWGVAAAEAIGADEVARFIDAAAEIDVLVLGMGADIAPLPGPAREALERAEMGYELMSTASACRTYNVLLAEGRRVAAGLIAV